jgi:hypothetical protein
LHKFFVLPTCGTRLRTYKSGEWLEVYAELLHEEEIVKITRALTDAIDGMYDMSIIYGDIIENRGSQVTFSGLGQKAPIEAKAKFDPDQSLRKKAAEKYASDADMQFLDACIAENNKLQVSADSASTSKKAPPEAKNLIPHYTRRTSDI